MSATWQNLVPERLHDAVSNGLRAAFGTAEARSVEPVTGGASGATTLRLQVNQRACLLRVETIRTPWRNPHQYTCMRIAAEAAVAPPLYYVDDAAGVAIMAFVATKPLTAYPGGPGELVRALGRLTATLQATEPFPALMDYRTVVSKLTERLQARFASGLLDPHREALDRLCATLPWDPSTHVSSHNDPNPRNVLFDGQRLWLVDWETAYQNDPLVDVAILGDNLAQTPDLEEALLQAWLGHEPQPQHRQRLKALRSLTRLYYAGMLAILIPPTTPVISDLAAPSREDFAQAIANGSLKFTSPETRITLVKMCLAGFLESLQ